MPTKILRECEFTFDVFTNSINKSVETGYFPDSLKLANVTPVFKKEDPFDKSNYRPVSMCVVSKRHIARNMLCSNYFSHGNTF